MWLQAQIFKMCLNEKEECESKRILQQELEQDPMIFSDEHVHRRLILNPGLDQEEESDQP